MSSIWSIVGILVLLPMIAVLGVVVWRRMRMVRAEARLQAARRLFKQQREYLEARFFTLASESGRPRGLSWVECDFDNEVSFARDKHTGELRALVAVNISFAAIEGGGMEDNPNVGRVRAATAVFLHRKTKWETDGRAIMNLDPRQAISHFQHELETVD
jgi:hypothetical protein